MEVNDSEVAALREQVTELVMFDLEQSNKSLGLVGKAKRVGKFIQQKTPPNVLDDYCPQMATWIEEAIATGEFDAVVCEDSSDEIYIKPQWHQQLGVLLNLHFSESGKYQQESTSNFNKDLKDRINLGLHQRYEQSYLEKFNEIITVTNKDKRILRKLEPESVVTVIPNGVELTNFPYRPKEKRNGNSLLAKQEIVFVGNMNRPVNIDAAKFLALEIFPAICQRYPEAVLKLVGAQPSAEVLELNELSGVTVTGKVESVVKYLHSATVCVIPIRQGYGLRNRTLEAMAAGVPVVGSDRALSEFEIDGAVPLRAMRANTIEEYVYAIGRLFCEPKLQEKLSVNARSLVETEYTWDRIGQKYEQVLVSVSKQQVETR
jgi:glycosyltransferase involved in cell wall biosynthesis